MSHFSGGSSQGFSALLKGMLREVTEKAKRIYSPSSSLFIYSLYYSLQIILFCCFVTNIPMLCIDVINYKPINFSQLGDIRCTYSQQWQYWMSFSVMVMQWSSTWTVAHFLFWLCTPAHWARKWNTDYVNTVPTFTFECVILGEQCSQIIFLLHSKTLPQTQLQFSTWVWLTCFISNSVCRNK